MLTLENGIKALQEAGAKITTQRIAIMRALEGRMDHPTAEQIFTELKPNFPTLSIATVYSTTRLLANASVARILTIDDKKVYFDPDTSPHSHFMCTKCRKIVDVPMVMDCAEAEAIPQISSISNGELFLYGICSDCAR